MSKRGAIFTSSAEISLESEKKHGIFHLLHANGGATTPPGYATVLK